jgi:hypothetical protein
MLNSLERFSKKSSNIKFHQNPSNGSQVVSCGTTDMTKLIVAFRNFANVPKKWYLNKQSSIFTTQICALLVSYGVFVPQKVTISKIKNKGNSMYTRDINMLRRR